MLAPHSRTLVIGGARSGKSAVAEDAVAGEPGVVYVATSYPADSDPEWAKRVRRHRERRPASWSTVETLEVAPLLAEPGPALLVDCLTLWLTRIADRHDAWASGEFDPVEREIDAFVAAWEEAARPVVAVTNEVGSGIVPESASVRRFRDLMGVLNTRVAAASGDVLWCVAGRVVRL
jgi:adenosylcobinamide kinase / adenosylcobinamide-phosphate guanylyltransferase